MVIFRFWRGSFQRAHSCRKHSHVFIPRVHCLSLVFSLLYPLFSFIPSFFSLNGSKINERYSSAELRCTSVHTIYFHLLGVNHLHKPREITLHTKEKFITKNLLVSHKMMWLVSITQIFARHDTVRPNYSASPDIKTIMNKHEPVCQSEMIQGSLDCTTDSISVSSSTTKLPSM